MSDRESPQQSGPFGPHRTLCQGAPGRGGGVHLPACRAGRGRPARMPPGGGQSMKHPLLILQRGRLSRPCLRRSLSAAALRGRHRIRHQSCKPDWVRRARTGRQPAAAPLRAASGAAVLLLFRGLFLGPDRRIVRAAGVVPRAGPALGPVQVEGAPALAGVHGSPPRRRASISKSRARVSGS